MDEFNPGGEWRQSFPYGRGWPGLVSALAGGNISNRGSNESPRSATLVCENLREIRGKAYGDGDRRSGRGYEKKDGGMMPSKLIKLLQAAKTELEVRGLSNSNVYSAISSEIYYLEEEEGLPQNWREGI